MKTYENQITDVKNYWNSRPCNLRHSPSAVGTKEYFDEVEHRKYYVEPHIPSFAQFEQWRGKKVLEIGCGIGTDTMNFARHGAFVTAVDLSEESIKLAKKRAEIYGLQDQIKFYCGNAENLETLIPNEKYDLIYSFGVIHHSPNPDRIVAQMKQFTHPGTQLKIMVYYRYSWKVLWILLKSGMKFWKAHELIARYSEAQTGCPITFTYSALSAKQMFKKAGFQVSKTSVDHIFPYSIPEYKKYEYKKVWYFRFIPKFIFRLFEKRFGWHLMIAAKTVQNKI